MIGRSTYRYKLCPFRELTQRTSNGSDKKKAKTITIVGRWAGWSEAQPSEPLITQQPLLAGYFPPVHLTLFTMFLILDNLGVMY